MSRFFGMYRVKMYHLEKRTKFIIMNSVFDTDKYLHSFYDLKGSILGRKAKKSDTVKKDNDLREKLPKSAISLHPSVREKMRKQLEIDCNFLASMKIMDYSLLVGIHEKPIVWETNTTLSEPISPGGTHSVAVEVESFPFRKRWNQPVSSVPMFPSISILNDGGIEVLNNSNTASPISMLSGDSHVVSMKNSPSLLIPDNNVRPGLLPKEKSLSNRNSKQNKLNRANSAPNARSLLSGSLQTSQKRFSTTGTGLSNTATDTNEGIIDVSWPAIQLSPRNDKHFEYYSRDPSISSASTSVAVEHLLDSPGNDFDSQGSDDQTQNPLDLVMSVYDEDNSYIDEESLCAKDELKLSHYRDKVESLNEKMYWPFHRLYNVLGHRRLKKSKSFDKPIPENLKKKEIIDKVVEFIPPISNRIDNGLEMDLSIFDKVDDSERPRDKIFFVGIIDILQQFNSRKRVEAKFRYLQTRSRESPSCVHPQLYADRFITFFDEYTLRNSTPDSIRKELKNPTVESTSEKELELDYDGIEEITFNAKDKSNFQTSDEPDSRFDKPKIMGKKDKHV